MRGDCKSSVKTIKCGYADWVSDLIMVNPNCTSLLRGVGVWAVGLRV